MASMIMRKKKVDVSYINTIRGCPYKCTYCASPFHWDRRTTRLRSPESSNSRNETSERTLLG